MRKALRGDDKTMLAFNAFLGRNVGFGKEVDHILKHYVFDTKLAAYQSCLLRSLDTSYFVKVRFIMATAMAEHKGTSGDFVYWDASRVASKEVLLVHAWLCGHWVSAPLQVLPDQTSVHALREALQNVA